MTCSRRFDRLLQASCLGLVGMLALASCGGSSDKPDAVAPGDGPRTEGGSNLPDTGLPVAVTVKPASVTFDPTAVGEVSAPKTVTVEVKNGTATINPTVTGEFSIVSTTCGTALTTCTISVQFGPGSTGLKSGILTIQPGLSVSLSGQGVPVGTFTVRSSLIPDTILVDASQPVSVTVTSTAALTDLKCEASGADLTADPTKTTCTGTIAASTPCVYAYIFKSSTPGTKSDAVVCSSKGISQTVTINPTVVEPSKLLANPVKLEFAGVINATSPAQTVNIINQGGVASGTLTATIAAGANTTAAEFAFADNKCLVSLAALSTCPIQIVFKPATVGAKAATLTVTDGVTPITVPLTGTGIADSKVAITGPATFAAALIGTPSAPATYTVTNSGGTATGLLTMSIADAQFEISSDLCSGLPLAAGKTCTLAVVFTPSKSGASNTLLNATSAGALLASLAVTGTGTPVSLPANLVLSPPTLDFGTIGVGTTAAPKTFTVTNAGATASAVLSVEKNDSTSSVGGASQFSYTTTCQAALEPGQTCTVTVTFTPTISRSASATIIVKDGAVTSNAGTVVGIALDRPLLSLSAGCAGPFAETVVGQTSASSVCTVTNTTGTATPQETGALTFVLTGDFAIADNGCTASLLPGLSCNLSLVFKPTAKGARVGDFKVTSANMGAANNALSGTGLGIVEIVEYVTCTVIDHTLCTPSTSDIEVQPYDFGQVTVGRSSATTLTLAVYVRAAVGNLSVTKAFGTPEEFAFVSVGSSDCDVYASASPPAVASRSGLTVPLCYKVVTFNPLNRAAINGSVTVAGANGDSDSATMKGTGTGPLTVTPSPVTFSSVAVGTSEVRTLTVTNNGPASLTINNMAFTLGGANANQFTVVEDNLTGVNLAGGGATATVSIRFIPTVVGNAVATFTATGIRNDSSAVETATDGLQGGGAIGADMTVTIGNSGVFADTYAGATSAPLTITVTNAAGSLATGAVTFTIDGTDFTTTPPTGTLQGTCADASKNPVNGGATCTEFVWFKPSAASNLTSRTGIITVNASPGVLVDLPLSGNALPQLSISPAGPATAPFDLGTAVIDTSTQPSQIFTITNHAETAIAAGGLVLTMENSTNTPNQKALFSIDNTASNTCNVAVAGGATCQFKVTAIAVTATAHMATPTNLGVFYGQIQGATGVQRTKADVMAKVASKASLALTPATDHTGIKDIGVVALGATSYSAPIKYTLVNNGGVNSGAIAVHLYGSATAGSTTALAKPSEWALSPAMTCPTTETGLAPGATCDIFVTFHPTVDAPATTDSTAYLAISNTAGISTGEIRRGLTGHATLTQLGPYLVDGVSKLAPSDMGAPTAGVWTRTVELHAGNVGLTPAAGLATVTPSVVTDTIVVAAGDTNGCVAGTAISANGYCNIKLTITAAATTGWHEFTVTSNDAGAETMKLFGRVAQAADLLASSDSLDFGMVPVSTVSPTQTITITNMGEATTPALVVAPSTASLVKTSGTCSGATLAYLATCTLNVWVTPSASPGAYASQYVRVTATTAIDITVAATGAGAATLSTDDVETTFASTAVLSTTTPALTFTFNNAANALTTGPLAVSVLSGTTVVPDFIIQGGTCLTGTESLGLDAADTCTVIVKFKPRSLVTPAKVGTLTVTAAPGGTATVVLRGTAVAALSATGATGGVGVITSGAYNVSNSTSVSGAGTSVTVTFTNEAAAPQTGLLSAGLTGTNAAEFRVTDDNCTGVRVAAGGTCTVVLLFKPTTQGAKTATLTVSGTPGDSAALVLNGTAVIP